MSVTLLKVAADLQVSLAAAVSVGATTATLSTGDDSEGVALPSGKYGFTVDGDTSAKEYIVCDLVGTALTNVVSISVQGASTSGFTKYHRFGATVTITDWAIWSRVLNNLTAVTGFDSATNLGYDGAPVGLTGNQFATVAYVLSVVSGGAVAYETETLSNQTSGEILVQGEAVYFKESDQKWWKTDADTTTTFYNTQMGIAGSSVGANASVSIITGGVYTTTGLTAGSKYYLSTTAGALTVTAPSAPSYSVVFGVALSTTKLYVFPQITTGAEQGSNGFPSSNNKFLTQDLTSDGVNDTSTQTTRNGGSTFGAADTTTNRNKVAQSFLAHVNVVDGVALYKDADTGSFSGTVTISLQADSAGAPSGVALATKTITNTLWLAYATGEFLVYFTAQYATTPGLTYWIVAQTSTADSSNHPNLGINTAGGYSDGLFRFNNTTDGWTTVAGADAYFKVLHGMSSKVPIATSAGLIPPRSRGLLYKIGTLALNNGATTTLVHGLGKVPLLIRASYGSASSSSGALSSGAYDVANNTYASVRFFYNEGTAGSGGVASDRIVSVDNDTSLAVTIVAIDENIIIFSNGVSTSSIAYEVTA